MGYHTYHQLTIVSGNDGETDYEQEISEAADYSCLFDESCKWYDCEKDMREYSKKHPETVFLIEGEGEESGDLWKSYFKNGQMFHTKAKLIFEDFEESKLS